MHEMEWVGGLSMVLRAMVFTGTSTLARPLFSLPSLLKGDLAMEVHPVGSKMADIKFNECLSLWSY